MYHMCVCTQRDTYISSGFFILKPTSRYKDYIGSKLQYHSLFGFSFWPNLPSCIHLYYIDSQAFLWLRCLEHRKSHVYF